LEATLDIHGFTPPDGRHEVCLAAANINGSVGFHEDAVPAVNRQKACEKSP
jgi:hypothetical protein